MAVLQDLPAATMAQAAPMVRQAMALLVTAHLLATAHQTIIETQVPQAHVTAATTTAAAATHGTEQATRSKMLGIVLKTVFRMHGTV